MSLRESPTLTPALLAAARRKARQSTGPRTPAGKQRVSPNALKHGRNASPHTLRESLVAREESEEVPPDGALNEQTLAGTTTAHEKQKKLGTNLECR